MTKKLLEKLAELRDVCHIYSRDPWPTEEIEPLLTSLELAVKALEEIKDFNSEVSSAVYESKSLQLIAQVKTSKAFQLMATEALTSVASIMGCAE